MRTLLALTVLVVMMSMNVPTVAPMPLPKSPVEQPVMQAIATPTAIDVSTPVPVVPYEVYGAVVRHARAEDVSQWMTILRCETAGFDNDAVGIYGEVSIAQILPSTLAGVGLSVADVRTIDSAVYAAVRVSEQAYRERSDKFWPWSTRYGCSR